MQKTVSTLKYSNNSKGSKEERGKQNGRPKSNQFSCKWFKYTIKTRDCQTRLENKIQLYFVSKKSTLNIKTYIP
jgi:hypothetical protein